MPQIEVPLTLGDFLFEDFYLEVPEQMSDLGGVQITQQHDFPGGIRTQQVYGFFPASIRWRARFSGGLASDEAEQVKRIMVAGSEVALTWGERSFLGLLVRFQLIARHTWLFEYECEFWPRIDQSAGVGESDGSPSPEELMDLQILALNSWLEDDGGLTLYGNVLALTNPINSVLSAVDLALAASQGLIALMTNLQRLAIQTATQALLIATAPLQAILDPLIASPAWDIAARAMVINNLVTQAQTPKWVVPAVNPNLMALSAQYYGNAAAWRTIATANGLSDPQPVGNFQLLIPPAPSA